MTRYVIDAAAAIEIARGQRDLAVTRLQADALIALDPRLSERAQRFVPLASLDELLRP